MKKYFIIILIVSISNFVFGQTDSTVLYLRFPIIPSFKLTNVVDSSVFTKENLKKNVATVIMIFSPDCDHCQHETKELEENINLFKKAQIIMSSPLSYEQLKKFYADYKIADYPNITIGRDPSYFLGTFYKIHSFPAIFLYDKKGNYIDHFDGSVPVQRIAAAIK